MIHAKSYRDLEVYKLSRELSKDIFDLSKTFPKEETYSLTDQIRRSSRSVGAQISEAWAKRRYEKHFVSKLTDADGELQETQHWLETSFDCKYIDKSILDNFLKKYESVGKMINSMINKSNLFCKENY
jgi:four helix bundle protein